jgi:hypothetical protein
MAVKKRAEYREGPEAAQRFDRAMNQILSVTKAELAKRDAAHKEKRRAEKRPRKQR